MASKATQMTLKDKSGVEYTINVRWTVTEMEAVERELGQGFMQTITTNMGFTSALVLFMQGVKGAAETDEQRSGVTRPQVSTRIQEHIDGGGSFPTFMVSLLNACKAQGILERDGAARPPA